MPLGDDIESVVPASHGAHFCAIRDGSIGSHQPHACPTASHYSVARLVQGVQLPPSLIAIERKDYMRPWNGVVCHRNVGHEATEM